MRWLATLLVLCLVVPAQAAIVGLGGGKTNIDLKDDFIGLVEGVSGNVPAEAGYDVAFGINSRGAAKPTTFTYDSVAFAPFAGEILHTGIITFNLSDFGLPSLTGGDFLIGFDGDRNENASQSGFFVQSTAGDLTGLVLFDVGAPSNVVPSSTNLLVDAPLFFSPELDNALDDPGIAFVEAGSALIQGTAIPEPSSALVMGGLVGIGAIVAVRRRRRHS